jgi:nitrous oxidase accessory protein NosD
MSLGYNVKTSSLRNAGNTFYVGGTGPGNYSEIQKAIDDSTDGDTIFVYSGTYFEEIVIKKSINLIGQNRHNTIIDGTNRSVVVYIKADNVIVEEFTIQYPTIDLRTGIYIEGSYAEINKNIIQRTINGIVTFGSDSTKIIGNIIAKSVLGIKIQNSFLNIVERNNFIENVVHAKFQQSLFNIWDSNYWDKGSIRNIKMIFGSIGFNINLPWIQFDRHSAEDPYNI